MPYCPYCGATLPKTPQRKTKCPNCKEFIYVRTSPVSQKNWFLFNANQEFHESLKQSRRFELLNLQKQGFTELKVIAAPHSGSCQSCIKSHEKVFTIEEALKKEPIPTKNCSYEPNENKQGFCRCIYLPKIL